MQRESRAGWGGGWLPSDGVPPTLVQGRRKARSAESSLPPPPPPPALQQQPPSPPPQHTHTPGAAHSYGAGKPWENSVRDAIRWGAGKPSPQARAHHGNFQNCPSPATELGARMGAQKGSYIQQTSYVTSPSCLVDLHNNPVGRRHCLPFTDGKTEAQNTPLGSGVLGV